MLTIEEAIAMQGEEFIYKFLDGDTIPAYVKKFIPEKGLSCWSFGMVTDQGFEFKPLNKEEGDEGASCLIGYDFRVWDLEDALRDLEEIKNTGRFVSKPMTGSFGGCRL